MLWHIYFIQLTSMFNSNQVINFKRKFVCRFKNSPKNEQKLIKKFFYQKSTGYYVDVGANEPVKES